MIMTYVFEQNLTEFDAAIRVWSNKDPVVAKQHRKTINMRLTFARKAFAELGFEGDDLEMRARTFLGFLISERQAFGPSTKTSHRYRERRLKMLLGETD